MSHLLTNDLKHLENEPKIKPVIYPIITSSTYKIENIKELYTYSRSDNPTRKLLEKNLAILEKIKI